MIQTARRSRGVRTTTTRATTSGDIISAHLLVLLLLVAFSSSSPSVRRSTSPTTASHHLPLQPLEEVHDVPHAAVTPAMVDEGMSLGRAEDRRRLTAATAAASNVAKKRRRPIITGDPSESAGSTTAVDQYRVPVTEVTIDDQVSPPQQLHAVDERYVHPRREGVECQPLRRTRYLSDGFCTSLEPVEDVVCIGSCLPMDRLPWYAEFIKVWSSDKANQYRCVDDIVRVHQVELACADNTTRSYKIRLSDGCRCKRHVSGHNGTPRTRNRRQRVQLTNQPTHRK